MKRIPVFVLVLAVALALPGAFGPSLGGNDDDGPRNAHQVVNSPQGGAWEHLQAYDNLAASRRPDGDDDDDDDDDSGGLRFAAVLSNAQEVHTTNPGLIEDARIEARFDAGFTRVDVRLVVDGGANVVAAHFHCARPGANGPVTFGFFSPGPLSFDGSTASGALTNVHHTGADCMATVGRPVNNIASLALAMRDGLIYANVHTSDNPPGEVRGQMLQAD